MHGERIWTKQFVLLMTANFFIAINFYALLTTAAGFAIGELGASEGRAGFAAGIFIVGALISRILAGSYVDRIGFRRILLIAISAGAIFSALYFMTNGFAFFCVVRFLSGASFGINNNTMNTLIARIIPPHRSGEGLSWFSLSQILGMAIGPFLAVTIMRQFAFVGIFLFATLIMVAALFVVIIVKLPKELSASTPEKNAPVDLVPEERGLWRFFERGVFPIAILCFLLWCCYGNYMSFAATFTVAVGAASISSYIFLASAGVMLVARPFIGKAYDKRGPKGLMLLGFFCMAVGLFFLGRGLSAGLILIAAGLTGLGVSSIQAATLATVVTSTPRRRLGVANATYFIALDLGVAVGPVIGGQIIEYAGYGAMFWACAVLAIACLPLYFLWVAKQYRRDAE